MLVDVGAELPLFPDNTCTGVTKDGATNCCNTAKFHLQWGITELRGETKQKQVRELLVTPARRPTGPPRQRPNMAPISGRPRITSWKSEDLIKTNKDLPLAPKSNPSLDLACSVSVVESFGTVFALLLDCEGSLDCFGHQHECRRELHTVDGILPHKEDLSARKRKLKRRAGPGPQLSSQISLSLNMKTNYGMKSQILDEKSVSYFAIFRGYCQPL